MGHVAIAFKWGHFLFHPECSINLKSILETGLIAGRKESREGRQIEFFTPVDPSGNGFEEIFQGGISKPRKAHYNTEWKRARDAVYWIHLTRIQEKQNILAKKNHAVIAHKKVLPDCIERMISQESETTLYQRLSLHHGQLQE